MTSTQEALIREKTNRIKLEIKEIRRQLGIDDDSVLFQLKNKLLHNKTTSDTPKLTARYKLAELEGLTHYLSRLKNLKKTLFFIPILIQAIDRVRYGFAQSKTRQSLRQIMNMKKKIMVFGAIPYKGRFQRPQHLSEQLTKRGWGVVYVEMTRSSFPSITAAKMGDNIYNVLISSSGNPNTVMQLPTATNQNEITHLLSIIPTDSQTLIKIDHPFWSFITKDIKLPIVYDCMDDHESFEAGNAGFFLLEKELVPKCSFVTASSAVLADKMKRYGSGSANTILLRNAGEYEHFAKALTSLQVPGDMKGMKGKTIGYYGAIAEWFDENIILKLAQSLPNDSIVLIGQVSHPTLKARAHLYGNIHFLGEKPYEDLPAYLQLFNVCLIPFILNDLIKATNPVKIYEYFAAGKPVVSTNLPELQEYQEIMYLTENTDDFVKMTKKALEENDIKLREKRQVVARNNTWEIRGEILHQYLLSILS